MTTTMRLRQLRLQGRRFLATTMAPKLPSDSAVFDTRLVLPSSSSSLQDNRVWGDALMKEVDMAALNVASRHSRDVPGVDMAPPVTAAIDDVTIMRPVRVGQIMSVSAHLTRVWKSSMEVEVIVEGEDLNEPEIGRWPVLCSHLTFIGLDAQGNPAPVPPLTPPETPAQIKGYEEAEKRKEARAARRQALREMPSENAFRLPGPPLLGSAISSASTTSAKTPQESFVQMTEMIFQKHTNSRGTAFGGQILAWGGMTTAVSATRHCRRRLELAAVHDIQFLRPIKLGDIVQVRSQVIAAFKSSVVVGLDVLAEDPDEGQTHQALTANFVYLTPISDAGKRPSVPALQATNEAEAEWAALAATYGTQYQEAKRLAATIKQGGLGSSRSIREEMGPDRWRYSAR